MPGHRSRSYKLLRVVSREFSGREGTKSYHFPKGDSILITIHFEKGDHLHFVKVLKSYKLIDLSNFLLSSRIKSLFCNSLLTKRLLLAVYWPGLYTPLRLSDQSIAIGDWYRLISDIFDWLPLVYKGLIIAMGTNGNLIKHLEEIHDFTVLKNFILEQGLIVSFRYPPSVLSFSMKTQV